MQERVNPSEVSNELVFFNLVLNSGRTNVCWWRIEKKISRVERAVVEDNRKVYQVERTQSPLATLESSRL